MDILNMETFGKIICQAQPQAVAQLRGSDAASNIGGTVRFYRAGKGTQVVVEAFNLPRQIMVGQQMEEAGPFHGFHIHEGMECGSGAGSDPFPNSGTHFNPTGGLHPMHAGDMPAILADSGYGYMSFYTSRFTPEDVIGRTVVVHQKPDDFHTQSSGDSGKKIACGKIEPLMMPSSSPRLKHEGDGK